MKNTLIVVAVIIVIGLGAYFLIPMLSSVDVEQNQETIDTTQTQDNLQSGEQADSAASLNKENDKISVIGKTAEGRNITVHKYGNGDTEILFIAGIHGGYEWNTVLLAYEAMDYLEANPDVIPANVKVTVIPVLNPDGLNKVVGTPTRFELTDVPASEADTVEGRFNSNNVDLNRNFDCDWQSKGAWQDKEVDGGSKVFSELESQAIKNYIENKKPKAVIVWYSAAGGVFSSSCHNGVLEETRSLTNTYAKASGYPAYEEFNFYEITGDMVNWLAKENIPAISVLLTNHKDIEWDKNRAGIDALLKSYAK